MSESPANNPSDSRTYPPPQAPPVTTGAKGTLAAASFAVLVAHLANAMPGALNGVFQQTFSAVGSQLTWITAAFMIPVVVFELTFGVLGDKYGHRRLVAGGAALVIVGALCCTLSPSIEWMWVGSALNGLGAGAIYPASLALVASVARNPRERIRGIAVWSGFLSLGSVLAPLLGGTFAGLGWWRGAYAVLLVAGLVSVVLTMLRARESARQTGRRMDLWGQSTFALGLILVLFGLVQGPENGWSTGYVLASLIVGTILLIAFVVIELRVESPLLDLRLFRSRQFAVSSILAVVGMFAFLGALYSTSMWLGPVQHQNGLYIGLLFVLLQGPAFFLIPLIHRLQDRIAARWLLACGFLLMAIGAWMGSNYEVTNRDLGAFIVPSLLLGLGFALVLAPMTTIAVIAVPRSKTGMASATTNLLRDLGFALGPVLVGAIALSSAARQLIPSLETSGLAPDQLGPALGIAQAGGPLALNGLPEGVPGFAAHELAMQALGDGFSVAFTACAIAALAAALLSVFGLHGVHRNDQLSEPTDEAVDARV